MRNHATDIDSLSMIITKRVDYFHLRGYLIEFYNRMSDEVKILNKGFDG